MAEIPTSLSTSRSSQEPTVDNAVKKDTEKRRLGVVLSKLIINSSPNQRISADPILSRRFNLLQEDLRHLVTTENPNAKNTINRRLAKDADILIGERKDFYRGGILQDIMVDQLKTTEGLPLGFSLLCLYTNRLRSTVNSLNKSPNAEQATAEQGLIELKTAGVLTQTNLGRFILSEIAKPASDKDLNAVAHSITEIMLLTAQYSDIFPVNRHNLLDTAASFVRGAIGSAATAALIQRITGEQTAMALPDLDLYWGIDITSQNSVGQSKVNDKRWQNIPKESFSLTHDFKSGIRVTEHLMSSSDFFPGEENRFGYQFRCMLFRINRSNGGIPIVTPYSISLDPTTSEFIENPQNPLALSVPLYSAISTIPEEGPAELIVWDQSAQSFKLDTEVLSKGEASFKIPGSSGEIKEAIKTQPGFIGRVHEWSKSIALTLAAHDLGMLSEQQASTIYFIRSGFFDLQKHKTPEFSEYVRETLKVIAALHRAKPIPGS